MPGHIGTSFAELVQLFGEARAFELDGRFDDGEEVVVGHLFGSKTYNFKVVGEETSSFLESILGRRIHSGVCVGFYEAEEC